METTPRAARIGDDTLQFQPLAWLGRLHANAPTGRVLGWRARAGANGRARNVRSRRIARPRLFI
eukprot:4971501-Pyramimonas_sp.AAC.1